MNNGYVITSVLNTREQEVELPSREVQVIDLEDDDREITRISPTERHEDRGNQSCSRAERVVKRLRTDHLNEEEKRSLVELCFDYQDVFYLHGDKLSCTNAYYTVRTRSYPDKHETLQVAGKSEGGGRPASKTIT